MTGVQTCALPICVVGVRGGSLVINLPGSPKAALENLESILGIVPHALETLAGPFDHAVREAARLEETR